MSSGDDFLRASEFASLLAGKLGVPEKQVREFLQAQAEVACAHAGRGAFIPGLGMLLVLNRPARSMVMRFGPDAGQTKEIPGKRTVKFLVADAARELLLGPPRRLAEGSQVPPMGDVFAQDAWPDGGEPEY